MRIDAGARRRGVVLAALVTAIALAASGCHTISADEGLDSQQEIASRDKDKAEEAPMVGGRLVMAIPMESNGWNPFMNQWGDAPTMVGTSMIEPLAVQDSDGTPRPWLAERWSSNADHTVWDLNLRPGVVFHDYTPFDAGAAKRSLDKLFGSGLYSLQFGRLYDHVEVTGPLSVRVYLKVRWAQYPTSLVFAWMLAPSMLDRPDEGISSPVGTGPFRFKRWSQFQSLSVTRFDKYWRKDSDGRPLPYLSEVEFRVLDDGMIRESSLKIGDIDMALSAGSDIAERLQNDFEVVKDYSTQRTFMLLNTGTGNKGNPFSNIHARRALAYAADRRRVASKVGPAVEITTHGFRPDSPWAPKGADGYVDYDPAIARKEIDLYKKETGASSLSFTLTSPGSIDMQTAVQVLKENLAEVGIKMSLNIIEMPKNGLQAALGDFHATFVRTYDFPDPDQMNFFASSQTLRPIGELSLNISRYSTPALDQNLKIIRESTDPAERKAANDEVIRETNDAAINIWLYNTPESIVANRRVRGLDGFRSHPFANALPKPWLAEVSMG
jgi:peptide/nickel transport system substrate-binding protein